MPHEVLTSWLRSGKPARLNGTCVQLATHPMMRSEPIVVARGQAGAVMLSAQDGTRWVLKKFHQGRWPGKSYVRGVGALLPRHDSLLSGTNRHVLSTDDLKKAPGCYFSRELAAWLDGTILMPRVAGVDWATVADGVRDGNLNLQRDQRLRLCRNLAELVRLLEASGCAHRDISSGNVFIDTATWGVILIDFDSVYHASLRMPDATTCGTEGYTAPFVWQNGRPRPSVTWCAHGDRYSLALVSTEFLVLDRGAPLGAEGGMFDQEQLRTRGGATLHLARDRLRSEYADALPLFEAAINSRSCSDCPAPDDWLRFCDAVIGPAAEPPVLSALEGTQPDDFTRILQRRIPAAPVWPAPSLDDLADGMVGLPNVSQTLTPLPDDPWVSSALSGPAGQQPQNAAPSLESLEDPWQ